MPHEIDVLTGIRHRGARDGIFFTLENKTMDDLRITHVYDRQPGLVHIRLEKNSKGYNWEISYSHEDSETALSKIREVNAQLKAEYGQDSAN